MAKSCIHTLHTCFPDSPTPACAPFPSLSVCVPFILSPPCCLPLFSSRLLHVFPSLNSTPLLPLGQSVPPLPADMNGCVSWLDRSLQLLSANCNSLPLMCRALSSPVHPRVCVCHSRSLPSLRHRSLYHVLLCTASLYQSMHLLFSLRGRPVRKIQPLVHEPPDAILSTCLCMCVSLCYRMDVMCGSKKEEYNGVVKTRYKTGTAGPVT